MNQFLKQPTTNMNKKKKISRIEMMKEFPFMREGTYNKGVKLKHQLLIEDPIPLDIATDIFTRLPADSVIKCKLVCKSWQTLIDDLIDDNAFVELHTRRKNSNYVYAPTFLFLLNSYHDVRFQFGAYNDKVLRSRFKVSKLGNPHISTNYGTKWRVIGSCNGLICISSIYNDILDNRIYICNPFTRENVKLPQCEVEGFDYDYIPNGFGFGYHRFTKEYKVVRIYFNKYGHKSEKFHVYTLGSRKWRSKGEISNQFGSSNWWGCGEFVNGALYWFNDRREIVSLDLADEEFRIVPLPPPLRRHDDRGCTRLGELRGCLCVIEGSSSSNKCESLIIWMMKNNENTWFKKFNIPGYVSYNILALLKGNEILLEDHITETIQSFDVRTDKITLLERISDLGSCHNTIPYVKSFVSLKALGEEDARIRHCSSSSSSRAESKIKN